MTVLPIGTQHVTDTWIDCTNIHGQGAAYSNRILYQRLHLRPYALFIASNLRLIGLDCFRSFWRL